MRSASVWAARCLPAAAGDSVQDDSSLVQATADADAGVRAAAFEQLYQRYAARIYAYLRARTAHPEDTADLIQQVFLQALDALPRYRQGGVPFAAWLFRIARNCAASFHRKAHATLTWDLLPVDCHPQVEDVTAQAVLAHEDRAYLRMLLETLPIETREMLALRFAAGLSASEIALVLGKREAAVKKRLTRAMQSLKERSNAITR